MQPTNPMQPRGSFSKPADLTKKIEQHEATRGPVPQAATPPPTAAEAPAETAPVAQKTPEQLEEEAVAAAKEKRTRWIKEIEEELGIELSDADIRNYIFRGQISKDIEVVKGMMTVKLKTLRGEELQEIDSRMAKIRDDGKHTARGLENEEAMVTLSYAWTHADGKELGLTPADREPKIRKMGAMFLERTANARQALDTLLRLVLQDRDAVKKS